MDQLKIALRVHKIMGILKNRFFSPYIALISAFATQMALLGFFPLSLSLPECVALLFPFMSEREREVKRKKKKKKKSPEKPLPRNQDLNSQTLSSEPSVLSVRPRCQQYTDFKM